MSYTPIEGGLPQNLLDEFRNISAAFHSLKLQLTQEFEEVVGGIEIPETPDFRESDAYKDLNREIEDVQGIMQEKLSEFESRIARVRRELGEAIVDYQLRDNSITGQIEVLKGTLVELRNEGSTLSSRVWEEIRTRISETGALAERVTLLEVSGGGYDDTALWAAVATEEQARIDGDTALASTLSLIGAESGGGTAFVLNQSTVEVSPGTSWASWEVTLQASIDGKATIAQWQEVRDDADSLLAKAGLQLNVDGHIIGWALNNNGDSGDMVIQVDRFFIVDPGELPTQIFYADSTGVYIDTAFIRELTVDVLTAGTLNVPIDLTGSITIPNTGFIRSGQTAWNVGTGWWMGHEGGVPKFSIGNPAGQGLNWSAATGLQITGSIELTSPIPSGDVSGLGALATLNSADYSANVSGTKPPVDATRNNVTTGTAFPTGGSNGDLYRRTGATDPGWYTRLGGVWYYVGDLTQTKIDGGIITTGFITLNTGGHIKAGKANYADDATSGFFLGRDGATPKFNIGNATQYLRWTGTALQVGGPIVSTANLVANAISTRGAGTAASANLVASWGSVTLSPLVTTGSQTHVVIATVSFTAPTTASTRWVSLRLLVEDLDTSNSYTTPVQRFDIPVSGDSPWPCNTTFVIPVTWTSSLGVQVTPQFFGSGVFTINSIRLDAVGMRR